MGCVAGYCDSRAPGSRCVLLNSVPSSEHKDVTRTFESDIYLRYLPQGVVVGVTLVAPHRMVVVQPRSQESVSAVKESTRMTLSRSTTQSSAMPMQLRGSLSRLLSSEESGKRRRGKRR